MKEIPIFEEVARRLIRQDRFWLKVTIGGLLSFVPVINFFAFGFLYRFAAKVKQESSLLLPEWTDWKGLFTDGVRFATVWAGYWLLPLLLSFALASFLRVIGLGALGWLAVAGTFVLLPALFGAALYRYMRGHVFKDLLDLPLIFKMGYATFPQLVVPSLIFLGVFALCPMLYGLTCFFGFTMIVMQTNLIYQLAEKGVPIGS